MCHMILYHYLYFDANPDPDTDEKFPIVIISHLEDCASFWWKYVLSDLSSADTVDLSFLQNCPRKLN